MKPIKILVFSQHPRGTSGGGILRYCNELKRLFDGASTTFTIKLVIEMPVKDKILIARYHRKELEHIIRESQCNIVHVNGFVSYGVAQVIKTAKKLGKDVVYTPHWHPFHTLRRAFLGKCFFKIFIKRLVKEKVDTIITFNEEDSGFFKKLNSNVHKIPHWIREENKLEKSYIEKVPNMLLFVGGRLNDSNKGIEHLYSLPIGKYDIHIVGEGNIKRRGDMSVHTGISDEELDQLYRSAGVVVVPSRYESFSYVTLEALSAGTPVVISNNVRVGDYLKSCPICKIFKYNDYDDFSRKIESIINKSTDISKYLHTFSREVALNSYISIYSNLVNSKN